MKSLFSLVAALVFLTAVPLRAQTSPVVVELYTSQGCSSCPPADELLEDLAKRDDIIALALHVDYWDYLGWKDTFGNAAYSTRQRAYARFGGRRMVYTPQMIINGVEDVVGAHAGKVEKLISAYGKRAPVLEIEVGRDGDTATIALSAAGKLDGPLDLHLVRYTPEKVTNIRRGENAGRRITYVNIVDGWTSLERWNGKGRLEIEAPVPGDRPAVLLVQRPGPGQIIGAMRLR